MNRGRRLEVAFVPVTTTRCPEYHLPSVPPHLPRTGRADEPANVSLRRMASLSPTHTHSLTPQYWPISNDPEVAMSQRLQACDEWSCFHTHPYTHSHPCSHVATLMLTHLISLFPHLTHPPSPRVCRWNQVNDLVMEASLTRSPSPITIT